MPYNPENLPMPKNANEAADNRNIIEKKESANNKVEKFNNGKGNRPDFKKETEIINLESEKEKIIKGVEKIRKELNVPQNKEIPSVNNIEMRLMKIKDAKRTESYKNQKEDPREYFKNRFLKIIAEEREKSHQSIQEMKERGIFSDNFPQEEFNFDVAISAFKRLAEDPKMPKGKAYDIKQNVNYLDMHKRLLKDAEKRGNKDMQLTIKSTVNINMNNLVNGLRDIFPEDVIKGLEKIKNSYIDKL